MAGKNAGGRVSNKDFCCSLSGFMFWQWPERPLLEPCCFIGGQRAASHPGEVPPHLCFLRLSEAL